MEKDERCDEESLVFNARVNEDEMIIIAVKNTFNHPKCYENGEIKSSKISNDSEICPGTILIFASSISKNDIQGLS